MHYVVIPSYKPNEKLTRIVNSLNEIGDFKIIVVKDGASDFDFSKLNNIILLKHEKNLGKGAALKTAFKYIKSLNIDSTIVTCDADGQHTIKDIIKVSKISEKHKDKLILGIRDFKRGVPMKSLIGNTITRFVFWLSSNIYIRDTQTGLRAFNSSQLDNLLKIEGERYEYEMNMLYQYNVEDIIQVPITTVYINNNESSHFRAFGDSFRIYSNILKFSTVSYISFLIDYFLFLLFNYNFKFGNIAVANVLASFISSNFNFYANNKYVFKNNEKFIIKYLKYILLAIFILVLNTIILKVLVLFKIRVFLAKLLTEILMFIVSYNIQKKFVFRNEGK